MGVDFELKTMQLDGKHIKLQIWDTNGCERFRSITTSYYRGAQGILLVYDVTDRKSFTHIDRRLTEIQNHCDDSNVNIVLIGSKCDLTKRRSVSTEEGVELAKKLNIRFFESSAKEYVNVEEPFIALVKDCCKRLHKVELESPQHSPIKSPTQSNVFLSKLTRRFLPRPAEEISASKNMNQHYSDLNLDDDFENGIRKYEMVRIHKHHDWNNMQVGTPQFHEVSL